ncbi:MAG: hypothetical protein GX923_09405 [Clostridia bacterium]|nr:hypothetical protein [Clostridia bacterium]
MNKLERSRIAGVISVFIDLEQDPYKREQLSKLMTALQSNNTLTKDEKKLLGTFIDLKDESHSYV